MVLEFEQVLKILSGAIKKWVELQKGGDNLIVMLADLHAITIPREPQAFKLVTDFSSSKIIFESLPLILFRKSVLETAASLVACGIDTKRSILYRQSDVNRT